MHNNFYFLRKLSVALEKKIRNGVISECFSQNKDELIIRLETAQKPFFIKASLSPVFPCLSFPDEFHRARKNSVDLFDNLIGQRVNGIKQIDNERSFAVLLTNSFSLLFKMHGNRANIILFKENDVVALFKNNITSDTALKFADLDREIDWSFENFRQHRTKLQFIYFTFGKIIWKHFAETQFYEQEDEVQWQRIQQLRQQLENPTYYLTEIDDKLTLSLLAVGKIKKEFQDPLNSVNEFFISFTQQDAFTLEKSSALSALKSALKASENYYEKTFKKLETLETENNYKTWADLIMANLYAIKPETERISLPDFYKDNHQIEIKLKKNLSPQKNAEIFYIKSKKQQQELNRLQQVLNNKEQEIGSIKNNIGKLTGITDLKTLRALAGSLKLSISSEKERESMPYHMFEYNGYKILVGKNAQSNDKLTLKHGYKEDLWLHAKDVTGSHVLIKYQSGKTFPKDVIERAAQLAAYNSKRKNESLCPVIVTPRKFVRKRKGDPAGAVVVEREEVIMVEPKL